MSARMRERGGGLQSYCNLNCEPSCLTVLPLVQSAAFSRLSHLIVFISISSTNYKVCGSSLAFHLGVGDRS